MSSGIWVAASGAVARQAELDATANNLANATTTAYKADDAVFHEHLVRAAHAGRNVNQMRLVSVREIRPDFGVGPVQVTNRPLDVAITDDSFFAVRTPNGERYTRSGNFQVASDGRLTTAEGLTALDSQRKPVRVSATAADLRIDNEGNVWADGSIAGKLRVVRFPRVQALEKEGHLLFRATPASGRPRETAGQLASGALEGSNMSVVKGMTEIVSASRAFDALEKAIQAFRDADRRAATDLMRS